MTTDSKEERAKEESRPEESEQSKDAGREEAEAASTKDDGDREGKLGKAKGIAAESEAGGESPSGGAEQKPDAGQAPREEDEGWPKSWIVTTAILGIVAIIIIARLVGQTWKKDDPIGRPPGFKDAKQEKVFPPGKRPRPGPGGEQISGLRATTGPVLAVGKNIKTMSGWQCLGKDGKLYALDLRKDRPEKCFLDAKTMLGYRVEMTRPEPMAEMTLMVIPSRRGEQPYFSRYMVLPHRSANPWFGVSHMLTTQPLVILALEANTKDAVTIDAIRISEQQRPRWPTGEAVTKLELKGIEFPKGGGYCVTPEKKVIPVKSNEEPSKECLLKVEGGSVFHIELTRETFRGELTVALKAPGKETFPLIDAFIQNRPPAEKLPEWIHGQMYPNIKELALVVNAVSNKSFKIGSLIFEVVR